MLNANSSNQSNGESSRSISRGKCGDNSSATQSSGPVGFVRHQPGNTVGHTKDCVLPAFFRRIPAFPRLTSR